MQISKPDSPQLHAPFLLRMSIINNPCLRLKILSQGAEDDEADQYLLLYEDEFAPPLTPAS